MSNRLDPEFAEIFSDAPGKDADIKSFRVPESVETGIDFIDDPQHFSPGPATKSSYVQQLETEHLFSEMTGFDSEQTKEFMSLAISAPAPAAAAPTPRAVERSNGVKSRLAEVAADMKAARERAHQRRMGRIS